MDDILLSHKDMTNLQESYPFLIQILAQWGLQIAAEKVQISEVGTFLGSIISPTRITPQKLEIRRDHLHTLNDFQKLLGDINWLNSTVELTTQELSNLFQTLQSIKDLNSPRKLSAEAERELSLVEKKFLLLIPPQGYLGR